jgi:hypothetical protein
MRSAMLPADARGIHTSLTPFAPPNLPDDAPGTAWAGRTVHALFTTSSVRSRAEQHPATLWAGGPKRAIGRRSVAGEAASIGGRLPATGHRGRRMTEAEGALPATWHRRVRACVVTVRTW